jgi:hypothetical protein
MVVTRLTLQRQVLAVQAHATSAAFVMTATAIRYQYKAQRQLPRAGWRGLAQGFLYSGHHRDDMLSNSSHTHSNQPSEETLPDAEETPSLKANDYDKNKLVCPLLRCTTFRLFYILRCHSMLRRLVTQS